LIDSEAAKARHRSVSLSYPVVTTLLLLFPTLSFRFPCVSSSTLDATAYTVVAPLDDGDELQPSDLRQILQKADDETKLDTLRRIIISTLNGSSQPTLLMPIIQYVLPSKNKQLKKMLHFYWEVCPKYDEQGKLKQEMILVVNAIRNDLQHPNEYIRGSTLRFLQKIKEPELLEALIPSVRSCLEHRHSYVRKNAVFCVYQIYRVHESMLSDAPELMETFLAAEQDATCKRNAFVLLCNIATDKAVEYLMSVYESITTMDELMQLAVIELIRKECKPDSPNRVSSLCSTTKMVRG
jgi:coatomer subunit beta